MVGVPGRSKACNTCRQRRIACGLERPQCAQCIKSNRWCGGYQRDRIWIHGQEPLKGSCTANRSKQRNLNGGSDSTHKLPSFDQGKWSQKGEFTSQDALAKLAGVPSLLGDDSMVVVANQQQFVNTFVGVHMPRKDVQHSEEWSWVAELPKLMGLSKALEASTLAIATSKIGRLHENQILMNEGLRFYGQGLKELQRALWDPKLMYKDETLVACLMLTMYEIFECPGESRTAYVTHSKGCHRLVQLRGPEAHTSGLGFHAFREIRTQGVLEALREHKASYLADPVWRDIPFKYHNKTPFDKVIDFLALSPWFWEEADKLGNYKSNDLLHQVLKLIDECWRLDADMRAFYKNLQSYCSGALYWPEFSNFENPADDPASGKLYPVSFHFVDLKIARTLLFYWSTLLMLAQGFYLLYGTVAKIEVDRTKRFPCDGGCNCYVICSCNIRLHKVDGATYADMSQLPPITEPLNVRTLADNVCQTVEYCLQPQMCDIGAGIIASPLAIVVETLRNIPEYKREFLWSQGAFRVVQERGFRILKHSRHTGSEPVIGQG